MDSCNSGSIQSSSCGDEEYDSRAESNISAFFNNNNPSQSHPPPPRSHLNPQHPSPPQHPHHHMFDPLSNYLDSIQKSPNQNPFLNLDMVWSKPTRSEPNPADLGGLMSPSSSSQQNQAFLFSQLVGQTRNVASVSTTHHYSLPPPESASRDQSLSNNNSSSNNNNNNNTNNMVRNPKKRSRASRRAPTTVLTTDTTNFRAMVQEFTGIPAPPFTSSPFPRTRLDLFGSAAIRSASSTHLDPPYLLRPFAQKVQPPQSHSFSPSPSSFPPSSSMVENLASNNSTNNNPSTNSASASINYHLSSSPADHLSLLMKQQQQQQPLNMHNQILGFQSISQSPPKYTLGNCSKTQQASLEISPGVDSHLKMGVLEELGLSHAHVNNNNNIGVLLQNMVPASSEHGSGNNHNNVHNSSADWAHRMGTVTDNGGDHDGGFLGSLSGSGNYRSDISERVSNGKVVNYSASPSEFRVEKGPECGVAARGEGTVESWINCSSD